MFCLRYSTLKLSRLPYQVTSITSTSYHKFDSYENYNFRHKPSVSNYLTCSKLLSAQKEPPCKDDQQGAKQADSSEKKEDKPDAVIQEKGIPGIPERGPPEKIDLDYVTHRIMCSFKEIQMKELTKAPTPMFWYGMAGLVPLWFPPISAILFGYSPFLATSELTYAALLTGILSGIKWGLTVPDEQRVLEPTWHSLGWALAPAGLGWLSLLLPQALGFLVVSAGIALAAFNDIISPIFPAWYRALRIVLSTSALVALFLMFLMRLFH